MQNSDIHQVLYCLPPMTNRYDITEIFLKVDLNIQNENVQYATFTNIYFILLVEIWTWSKHTIWIWN